MNDSGAVSLGYFSELRDRDSERIAGCSDPACV